MSDARAALGGRLLRAAKWILNHPVWGSRGSHARWLIPAFGALLIASLWFGTLARLANERRLIFDAAMQETEGVAATFEQRTLRTIKNADVTALMLKYLFEHDGALDIAAAYKKGLIPPDAYLVVSIVDRNGMIVATTADGATGLNMADRDYFKRHQASDSGALDISKPVKLRVTGRTAVQLTRRLNAADGSFAGIVLLSVDPDFFTDFYSQTALGNSGTLGLLGTDGVFRARRVGMRDESGAQGNAQSIVSDLAKANATGSFTGRSPLDGVLRLVAYRRLKDFPLIVLAAQSEAEVLAPYDERRSEYLWLSGLLSVVIAFSFAVISAQAWMLNRSRQRAWARARDLKLASRVYETTADGILLTDADDRIIMVNGAFTKLTGFSPEELLGRVLAESAFRPLDKVESAARFDHMLEHGHVMSEVTRHGKDGRKLELWVTASTVTDDGKLSNIIRVFTDISVMKQSQRQLEELASIDGLTGLPNRRSFRERLHGTIAAATRHGRRFALLYVDLDHFKEVNDGFGHETGDRLLQRVAAALKSVVRADDGVFRLGGDEFAVLVEEDSRDRRADIVAERIITSLSSLPVPGHDVVVTGASIGIARYPQHGDDTDALVRSADAAMYQAKQSGRNAYRVSGERAAQPAAYTTSQRQSSSTSR